MPKRKTAPKNRIPKVTVIIPVYNADRYLERCLDSVLSQALDNMEIICINDASEDNSLKILEKYKKSGIKVLTLNKRCGQAHARNIGIKEASGEYIGFVDADDFADKTMFEKLYNKAKKENADIEMCEAKVFDNEEQASKKENDYYSLDCFSSSYDNKVFSPEVTADFMEKINVTIWNKIYKTSFLKNSGVKFSEGYIYEDLPFFFEIYTKAERIGILREKLYFYRTQTKSSTMKENGEKVLDRVDMVEKTLEIFKKLNYYEKIKPNLINWIINDLFYRYFIIDSGYQKEFFFMMQKFFKSIDVQNIKGKLETNTYYPQFSEIIENNYSECIQHFANKDILYMSHIENMKINMMYQIKREKEKLKAKYRKEFEAEKEKLTEQFKSDLSAEHKMYINMLKDQFKLQEKNYKKINSLKKNEVEEKKMEKPIVSVILPVYNVAPYLRQSLDSLINQTLKNIEIICVDDGSTDESGKILDEYREKDERIKVIHKENAGTGAARNDGLKLATGECIGFVDPDDWVLPNMYERLYSVLKEKNLDIVMFTPDVFNDETQKHEGFLYFQNSNFPDFLDNRIFSKEDISPFSYPMCVWNKLYTKKLFDENNIDFAEGLDFEDHKAIFKSLFTAKRIYFIREKLYVYRHSRKGSILSDNDTRMFDHIKIYDIVENILKETNDWERFHFDFLKYKVHNLLYYYSMIKPQYKKDYYNKMVDSLRSTPMSEEEFIELSQKYPDLKKIMKKGLASKIKQKVKKILNKDN